MPVETPAMDNSTGVYGTTSEAFDLDWAQTAGRYLPDTFHFLGFKNIPIRVPDWTKPQDGRPRLFRQDWLEALTVVHPAVPPILFLPIAAGLLYFGMRSGLGWAESVAWFAAGVAIWSIAEYLMHRFAFHYVPKTRSQVLLMFFAHGIHHSNPDDDRRLVLPPSVSLLLGAMFFFLFRALFQGAFPPCLAGFYVGYVAYDLTHYAIHNIPLQWGWFNRIRKNHMLHHFSTPDRRFGVTSTFWDRVFGTHR